jgi:hypothetical protein
MISHTKMIPTRTTAALIAALSMVGAIAAPAAFAVNSANQGDISFLTNVAKIHQKAFSFAINHSSSGIGHSGGGNTVISANVQTADVDQTNNNPHANLLGQSTVCSLFGGSAAVGC